MPAYFHLSLPWHLETSAEAEQQNLSTTVPCRDGEMSMAEQWGSLGPKDPKFGAEYKNLFKLCLLPGNKVLLYSLSFYIPDMWWRQGWEWGWRSCRASPAQDLCYRWRWGRCVSCLAPWCSLGSTLSCPVKGTLMMPGNDKLSEDVDQMNKLWLWVVEVHKDTHLLLLHCLPCHLVHQHFLRLMNKMTKAARTSEG